MRAVRLPALRFGPKVPLIRTLPHASVPGEISLPGQSELLLVVFLFALALCIRLYHINEPPLDFHAVRQYHSLIVARGFYFESNGSVPDWERAVAQVSRQRQALWEPEIVERLAALGYRMAGGERYWIPRVQSSIFWLIGGVFVYLIARRLSDQIGALFALAFYLLDPFAVAASRSFQPDPLMVVGVLAAVFAILMYFDQPSAPRLVVAGLVSAAAILVKFVGLFPILGAFVGAGIARKGLRGFLGSPPPLVFLALSIPVTLFIYAERVLVSRSLLGVAQGDILPQLLVQPGFWRGWLHEIGAVVGIPMFMVAWLGILMSSERLSRGILLGLWAGYILLGLVFTYTISTHDYWNLQLVPIVALSTGSMASVTVNHLWRGNQKQYRRLALASVAVLGLALTLIVAGRRLGTPSYETTIRAAEEIGEQVGHSSNVIHLTADYGLPLEYHGLLSGRPWPLVSDLEWEQLAGVPVLSAEERFTSRFSRYAPDYFIVADLREFAEQRDLKQFLETNFKIAARTERYVIFDLRRS